MSVSVYLTPGPNSQMPPPMTDPPVNFNDVVGSEAPVEYKYEIDPSGALVVWRCLPDTAPAVEVAYGSAGWHKVTGMPVRSLLERGSTA
ncbi:hypothetical protein ACPA54_25980 [Uniformispora flossi]|uniref:hypothetical protein n=1 Tax=Uniformispora flossi TaxID=3390723 RepID=UPI003C30C876